MAGIFHQIQSQIDQLGFISQEITSAEAKTSTAPVPGKEEYEWYQNQIFIANDRQARYSEYESMVEYPIIASALDIYADTATQRDDDNHVLRIVTKDNKIQEELEELFYERLDIDNKLWSIIRNTCEYGDLFAEMVFQEDLKGVLFMKVLPPKSVVRFEREGKLLAFIQNVPGGASPFFDPFEIIHFKVAESALQFRPYGTSILEPARRTFRQLRLMEDAMVVYRISRAPERRVFMINVGNLPTVEAEKYIQRIKARFRKKPFVNRTTGEIDYKFNPFSVDEDFWFPFRQGQEGSKVEQLKGAENLGEIDDVKYFTDKIFAVLKIPRAYLQDVEGQRADRKANLAQQDVMFARTIERVQRHITQGLMKMAIIHLLLKGYEKENLYNFNIELTPPSNLEELSQMEAMEKRLNIAATYVEQGIPKEWTWEKILKFNEDDIKRFKATAPQEGEAEATMKKGKKGVETPAEAPGVETPEAAPEAEIPAVPEADPWVYEDINVQTGNFTSLFSEGELIGIEATHLNIPQPENIKNIIQEEGGALLLKERQLVTERVDSTVKEEDNFLAGEPLL